MSIQEYTLMDLESKLNQISNMSLFLATGSCPDSISSELHDHLHEEVETLQSMIAFMLHYSEIKAKELVESK